MAAWVVEVLQVAGPRWSTLKAFLLWESTAKETVMADLLIKLLGDATGSPMP